MTPKRTRRRFTAEFKAEVVLAALTERQPLAELAARYQLTVAQISHWKLQTVAEQRALVQAGTAGSVVARCQAVGLARSGYYRSRGETALNLQLMRLLDGEYTRHSFKGVLGMRDQAPRTMPSFTRICV